MVANKKNEIEVPVVKCPGCGADLTDPDDGCGCPEDYEIHESDAVKVYRDGPSYDCGR